MRIDPSGAAEGGEHVAIRQQADAAVAEYRERLALTVGSAAPSADLTVGSSQPSSATATPRRRVAEIGSPGNNGD